MNTCMESGSASRVEHGQRGKSYFFLIAGCVLLGVAWVVRGISGNLPEIASMLWGLFGLVLGIIYFLTKSQRAPAHQLLYWTPRALCIAFALFISMFALDVFEETKGFWQTLLALMMHLIPTYLLLIVLWASWRREWIGGTLFPLLAILWVVWGWNKPFFHWSGTFVMQGPLVLTGALFLLNWYYRDELRGKA